MCSNTQPWKEKQADGTENGAGRTHDWQILLGVGQSQKMGPSDHKELPNEVKVKYKSISNSS